MPAPVTDALLDALADAHAPLGPTELARTVGATKATVAGLLGRLVDRGQVDKVGRGRYALAPGGRDFDAEDARFLSPAQLARLGLVRVPIIEAAAGAAGRGDPENPDRDDWVVEVGSGAIYPEEYIRLRYGIPPDRLRSVRIVGDSMEPTIRAGAFCDICLWNGEPVRDGGVYLLASPHGTLLKRLRLGHVDTGHEDARGRPVSREVIRICSDNPSQEEYRLPPDVFERDYRILGWALEVSTAL
jgi:hypothetical protein